MNSNFYPVGVLFVSFLCLKVCFTSPVASSPTAVKQELVLQYASGIKHTFEGEHANDLPTEKPVYFWADGVWITYPSEHYKAGPGGTIRVVSRLANAQGPISDARIKSVRFAGKPNDNSVPFANLYTETDFQGMSIPVDGGVADFQDSIKSFITINAKIEAFEFANYEGRSFCIENAECITGVCLRWYYNSAASLPWGSEPKSIRIGCN